MPQIPRGRGEFRLFTEGNELYDTMFEAISRTRNRVRLESYIFADDEVGNRFVERASAGNDVLDLVQFDGLRADVDVRHPDAFEDAAQCHSRGSHRIRIDVDLILLDKAADGRNFADSFGRCQGVANV